MLFWAKERACKADEVRAQTITRLRRDSNKQLNFR